MRRPAGRLLVLYGLLLLVGLVVVLYQLGQQGCPPPDWAFWRFSEGTQGLTNFGCVA